MPGMLLSPSICLRRLPRGFHARCHEQLFQSVSRHRSLSRVVSPLRLGPSSAPHSIRPLKPARIPTPSIIQVRHYARRRTERPIVTSFPQFSTRPLKPLYESTVFWGGLGFVGLLIFSPIPGWILVGGISYGIYRLFRYLNRAREAVFGPRSGFLSTHGDGSSLLDSLFSRDPRTREVASKIQEMTMERVERAIETDEAGIRRLFPNSNSETSGEFHFTFPTEVSMLNGLQSADGEGIPDITFEMQIKFMMYLAVPEARKGAQVVARADVDDVGVRLTSVDIRDSKGGRRVKLEGAAPTVNEDSEVIVDKSGVGKGEGEGKTIDATRWTSR